MRHLSRNSLEDMLYIFFRHKNRVLIVMLLSIAGTGAWLAFQDTFYVAETRLLVRVGKEKVAGIETLAKDNYNILFQERGQDIHNGIEILKDQRLAYSVFERLRPMMQPPPPPQGLFRRVSYETKRALGTVKEWAMRPLYWLGLRTELTADERSVMALRQSLQYQAIEDSDVIRVGFAWPDPEFAAVAVNTFAQEFLAKYIRVHENAPSEEFYRDQIRVNEGKLAEADAALSRFRIQHGITNLSLQKELLLRETVETESKLKDATARVAEYKAMRDSVAAALASGAPWVQTPEVRQHTVADLSALDKQYFELVARRSQLLATMGDAAPELQQMGPRMARLRESKGQNLKAVLVQKISSSEQERAMLDAQLRDKRERLSAMDQHTSEHGELERARAGAEANYLSYKKKGEELRVSDGLSSSKISGVRVVSEATAPVEPAGPRRGLILGLAALLGLFFGIGFSAIAEFFNHTFRDEKDVEDILGQRVIMTVPQLQGAGT